MGRGGGGGGGGEDRGVYVCVCLLPASEARAAHMCRSFVGHVRSIHVHVCSKYIRTCTCTFCPFYILHVCAVPHALFIHLGVHAQKGYDSRPVSVCVSVKSHLSVCWFLKFCHVLIGHSTVQVGHKA